MDWVNTDKSFVLFNYSIDLFDKIVINKSGEYEKMATSFTFFFTYGFYENTDI